MHTELAREISEKKHLLGEWVTRQHFEKHPHLREKWGDAGVKRCSEDASFHFAYLAEAVRFDFPILFFDYLSWAKSLLAALRIPESDLRDNLALMKAAVLAHVAPEKTQPAVAILDQAIGLLPTLNGLSESYLRADAPHSELAAKWMELLLRHQPREGRRLISQAIASGASISEIYQHILTPALYEVGRLWQTRKINEAEEHYCSQATQTLLAVLSNEFPSKRIGRSVVGFSVGNETHEIGIRLVTDCFANHGWDSVCLGANVPTRNIDGILRTWAPDVVAISATMTYHLAEVQTAIQAIKSSKVSRPKILVGGKPFKLCPELGAKMGADVTAHNCPEIIARTIQAFE